MASKFIPGGYRLQTKRARTGRGLFTLEGIPKGKCIIEYTGPTLTKQQEYKSQSRYLFEVTKTKTIDGWNKKNLARYINHSCRPNCEIEIYKGRVYVFSKRAIKPEEELSYDYDTEYFNEYIKPIGCKCLKCSPVKK